MKTALVSVIALAVIVALGYVAVVRDRAARDPLPLQQAATTTAPQGDERTLAESTDTYEIKVTYRHFGIPALDAQLDQKVLDAAAAFKRDADEYAPEAGMPKYSFTGEMKDLYIGPDIASERIDLYQDTGGAHGLPIVMALNFDSATGQEVSLDRALSLIGLSLSEVSEQSLAQLRREFGESVFADGAAPRPENYGTFIVGPYNVTFIFQAYQVVAYAAGMPEVKFNRTSR